MSICRCNPHTTPTFSPEAEAPFRCGDLAIPVRVAGVEKGPNADLILVQVDGSQLGLIQIQVIIRVQLGEHPAYGVLTAGHQAPVQHCQDKHNKHLHQEVAAQMKIKIMPELACWKISEGIYLLNTQLTF